MKPLIKWVGGKSRFTHELRARMPKSWNGRIIVPFLGSGAFFLSLGEYDFAILNDANPALWNFWDRVSSVPDSLDWHIRSLLQQYDPSNESDYYKLRTRFNKGETNRIIRAAMFVILNKSGYRGLWRVNKKGELNVPFGAYKTIAVPRWEEITQVSYYLKYANIICGDFSHVLKYVTKDCFVYCDPPYDNTFSNYTSGGFNFLDHERLKVMVDTMTDMGANVMVTNSPTERMIDLYSQYNHDTYPVSYIMNEGVARVKKAELVITNYKSLA